MFTLGSASPRRSDLLASLGVRFQVETVDIDEAAIAASPDTSPHQIVERIARAKFAAFPAAAGEVLLTADTLVACDGAVLGKPASDQHLVDMLSRMSGRDLQIVTAVCVGHRGAAPSVEGASTVVRLRELTPPEIDDYVATGVGKDKAAGLALQAEAKPFITSVAGCWSNVLGLPLCVAHRLLRQYTVPSGALSTRCSVELCGRYDG